MANRQALGLGAVVLGIVLAAGLGIRSAASWLSRSTPGTTNQDGIVSLSSSGDRSNLSEFDLADSELGSAANRSNESLIGQANNNSDATQPLSSLEEAGTYVQRQKRVEQDAVIANTPVEVIPTASSNAVASQGNTTVTQQPTAPATTSRSTSTTTPAADPVPALW
ncbi:MAG: hypothetical protein AB8B99_08100 [Phormidesmis sp.]